MSIMSTAADFAVDTVGRFSTLHLLSRIWRSTRSLTFNALCRSPMDSWINATGIAAVLTALRIGPIRGVSLLEFVRPSVIVPSRA